jgi:hypothetical protein
MIISASLVRCDGKVETITSTTRLRLDGVEDTFGGKFSFSSTTMEYTVNFLATDL